MEKCMEISVLRWIDKDKIPPGENSATIEVEDVVTEHGVPRMVFQEYLGQEVEVNEACWSLPFTMLLVVSYALFAILHDNAVNIRAVEESIEFDIEENANFAFTGEFIGHKNVDDVNNVPDFYSWLSLGLLPLGFVQNPALSEAYDPADPRYAEMAPQALPRGFWLSYDRVVGGIRLQQERSGDGMFAKACDTMEDLLPFYGLRCVRGLGYELDPEMRDARYTTNPERPEWLWVHQDLAELQDKVWQLERDEWFDRKARKIEIGVPMYNAEFGVHSLVYVNFFISRGGHIWKSIIPLSTTAVWFPEWYYWAVDITYGLCMAYIALSEVIEIVKVIMRSGIRGFTSEYLGFWNLVDWMSIVGALAVFIMFIIAERLTNTVNLMMMALPEQPNPLAPGGTDPAAEAAYRTAVLDYMSALESAVQECHQLKLVMFAYPFLIIIRLFKAFGAQPRLALMTNTISRSANDLCHFGIVFFSIFLSFVVSGSILFGREVRAFGTFPRASNACFRMLVGDMDWDELRQAGFFEAAAYVWAFILLMVHLLLNMTMAIIMDHYVEAKEAARETETLWQEAAKAWKQWRDVQRGVARPLSKVLNALMIEEKRCQNEAELDESFVDEHEDVLGPVMMLSDLQKHYFDTYERELGDEQAKELMKNTVRWYYRNNHNDDGYEELSLLTQRVEFRAKAVTRQMRLHIKEHAKRNEMEALRSLAREVTVFTEELRQERDAYQREATELRTIKRGLLLQLYPHMQELGLDPDVFFATPDAAQDVGAAVFALPALSAGVASSPEPKRPATGAGAAGDAGDDTWHSRAERPPEGRTKRPTRGAGATVSTLAIANDVPAAQALSHPRPPAAGRLASAIMPSPNKSLKPGNPREMDDDRPPEVHGLVRLGEEDPVYSV